MRLLIVDAIGLILLVVAIVMMVFNIVAGARSKDGEINGKVMVVSIVLLGAFLFSSFATKYEVGHYVSNGYTLVKSVPNEFPTKYEEVSYQKYCDSMYAYHIRVDRKNKVVYLA